MRRRKIRYDKKTDRARHIVEMRDKEGRTFQQISDHYGITRQRAHQIYKDEKGA